MRNLPRKSTASSCVGERNAGRGAGGAEAAGGGGGGGSEGLVRGSGKRGRGRGRRGLPVPCAAGPVARCAGLGAVAGRVPGDAQWEAGGGGTHRLVRHDAREALDERGPGHALHVGRVHPDRKGPLSLDHGAPRECGVAPWSSPDRAPCACARLRCSGSQLGARGRAPKTRGFAFFFPVKRLSEHFISTMG